MWATASSASLWIPLRCNPVNTSRASSTSHMFWSPSVSHASSMMIMAALKACCPIVQQTRTAGWRWLKNRKVCNNWTELLMTSGRPRIGA
jgi:hypothetical protein